MVGIKLHVQTVLKVQGCHEWLVTSEKENRGMSSKPFQYNRARPSICLQSLTQTGQSYPSTRGPRLYSVSTSCPGRVFAAINTSRTPG
ncbi:hypothetical protein RRG08_046694 [Elysia crispata]|uniref:Uncharacterized protein n=1 Tax=Elysia crispata TaxID=231223 RepID=A0AAE1A9U2_9GAST|nr:hypothetical protein RRG08_046694 [Elysia crispata]